MDGIIYASVAVMWTGILTTLERESKVIGNYGLTVTTQVFLGKYFDVQTEYYNSLKRK